MPKSKLKIHALACASNYMSKEKLRILMNTFFTWQFGYCPWVWMFHSRTLNNRINKLREKVLRLVYNDSSSSFGEFLKKYNSFTIHHQNIQKLAIENLESEASWSPQSNEWII